MVRVDRGNVACVHLREAVPVYKSAPAPCAPAPWPFAIVTTLDEQLGVTDALIKCCRCEQYYLLELQHWPLGDPAQREYRLLSLPSSAAARFLYNVDRDYCDLARHQHELHALQATATLTAQKLCLDVAKLELIAVQTFAQGEEVSLRSWRETLS